MSDGSGEFSFDLDELDQLAARVNGFIGFLAESLDGLDKRMAAIQQNWQGAAAEAQEQAFRKWAIGAAEVLEGITEMRAAVVTAHDAYKAASDANLRMSGG
ncbi:WXG100 family type VII secretion target [Nocardia camponoti]|uniref:ESAT-6-like protein n=1 Tax=Nocardia camponoti TaxID=1616106 RepID=A0A917VEV6_9NOCA|nr:WXG100 family type VII secretion target [Nocardia camponoti]GGK67632.1 ESAT-6-like protein [Nocardia camponoti]